MSEKSAGPSAESRRRTWQQHTKETEKKEMEMEELRVAKTKMLKTVKAHVEEEYQQWQHAQKDKCELEKKHDDSYDTEWIY